MSGKNRDGGNGWIAIWLTVVFGGMFGLSSYSGKAGASGESPVEWPVDCAISRAVDCDTLLMFIHPLCPCSRASVQELARIHAQTNDRVVTRVVFFQPAMELDDWSSTDLVTAAARIPGVEVISDVDAALAVQFAVKTSGHVLLYDQAGRLMFSGGITVGRGHEGDNTGHCTVVSLIRDDRQLPGSCPVFGCPIVAAN